MTGQARLPHPFGRRRRRRVVVAAGDDLFASCHRIPDIARAFAAIQDHPDTIVELTTTHCGRARNLLRDSHFWWYVDSYAVGHHAAAGLGGHRVLTNLRLGMRVDSQPRGATQMPLLLDTPAITRYMDARPLRGPLTLHTLCARNDVRALDWVVASGRDRHPERRELDWLRSLRDQCVEHSVPFRFDGWGDTGDRLLDGHIWDDEPHATKVLPLAQTVPQ